MGQFKVVAWDAPGAGASSDPSDPFTISDWAAALAALLDAIGIKRGHVFRLSWGGLLAQQCYRLHPRRCLTLILADTYAGWKGSLGPKAAEQRLVRCLGESSLPAEEFVARWVPHKFFADARPELADEMASVVSEFHPHGFRLMAKTLADNDATDVLGMIDVLTLLLWGEHDQIPDRRGQTVPERHCPRRAHRHPYRRTRQQHGAARNVRRARAPGLSAEALSRAVPCLPRGAVLHPGRV
jgi:pimeloyl-ACP methyl ester carboxylesterase